MPDITVEEFAQDVGVSVKRIQEQLVDAGLIEEFLSSQQLHGQATKIQLRLQRDATGVRLVVFDDGCGFNPNQITAGRFGIQAMRQRTVWFGGDLTIDSTIGEGTTIRAEFPTAG